MYEAFYGLTCKPFQLNPDPSFFFGSAPHRKAMAYLQYCLHRNEGFVVVTGEAGTGKTTLVRSLLNELDRGQVIAATLVSTQLGADDMLRSVAAAFGIATQNTNKSEILQPIEVFLTAAAQEGKRCLLVVDEAQNLTLRSLEELRMLMNFQLDGDALLQCFLIGQTEFRQILQSPAMWQRVIAACHIGPLDSDETQGYIQHRLAHAGSIKRIEFLEEAYLQIFEASGGIPRRINSICERLLLAGFLDEKRSFARDDVAKVVAELDDELQITEEPAGAGKPGAAPGEDWVQRLSRIELGLQRLEGSASAREALVERLGAIVDRPKATRRRKPAPPDLPASNE
ncbi:MAG: DUF2075 domain-containing protein [Betaproteobacteria bacterium]|nr:DUF2075 domain-containing protein [Betaproteobacteria bacterium]